MIIIAPNQTLSSHLQTLECKSWRKKWFNISGNKKTKHSRGTTQGYDSGVFLVQCASASLPTCRQYLWNRPKNKKKKVGEGIFRPGGSVDEKSWEREITTERTSPKKSLEKVERKRERATENFSHSLFWGFTKLHRCTNLLVSARRDCAWVDSGWPCCWNNAQTVSFGFFFLFNYLFVEPIFSF